MVLRAVTPARASRMARSIDRNPTRGFAAGYLERVRRGTTRSCALEQDKRSPRAEQRALRGALLRQFLVKPRTNGKPQLCCDLCLRPVLRTEQGASIRDLRSWRSSRIHRKN